MQSRATCQARKLTVCPVAVKKVPKTHPFWPVMATGGSSPGWSIMRLFSPQPSGEEEPQTAPQQPAHSSPANPSPVVLEDMSPSEVVGHANEASQAHPSARDTTSPRAQIPLSAEPPPTRLHSADPHAGPGRVATSQASGAGLSPFTERSFRTRNGTTHKRRRVVLRVVWVK